MGRAGAPIGTLGFAQEAALEEAGTLDGDDDLADRELIGMAEQAEAAAIAALGLDDPRARQAMEDLRQVRQRGVDRGGQIAGEDPAVAGAGEARKREYGIGAGAGESEHVRSLCPADTQVKNRHFGPAGGRLSPEGGVVYDWRMKRLVSRLCTTTAIAALGVLSLSAARSAGGATPPPAPAVGSPEWIVDSFFKQKEFPELARYATGEFAELYKSSPTLGSIVPPAVTVTSRVLERDALHAIFAVTMTDSNVTKEWYAYLRLEGGAFKLEAIRTLTLGARFFETLVAAEKAALAGRLNALGVQELDRSHLTIAADAELKNHFVAQKPLFEALAKEFAALTAIEVVNFDGRVAPPGSLAASGASPERVSAMAQQLRTLTLGAAVRNYRDSAGCIALVVGGDGESQVGFLRAGPGAKAPAMSPASFIYVEPLGDGWYLFKTV